METVAALKEIIAAQREMIQFESKRFSDERKHWQVTNEVHRQQLVAPIPPPLSTLLPPLKELQDDQPLQKREEYLHRRISDLTDRIVELAQGAMSTTAAVALASPATPHPYPAPSEERISTSPSAPSADFAPPPPPSSPTPTAASSNGFSPPLSDLDDAATE